MSQKVEEAQMTSTAAQLDGVKTVHAKITVSVHNINAIPAKHKLRMKESRAMRENQMNQLVSLKSEVKSEQENTPKVVPAVVREFQADTVAMNLNNNAKIIYMSANQ